MRKFTETNYKQIINSNKTAMIFFTSSGCHLCIKLKPILKKLENQYSNNIDFYVCDINKEKKLSNHLLKDEGVPTGFVINSGKVFKMKDPENPDTNSWYGQEYLEEIIQALIGE